MSRRISQALVFPDLTRYEFGITHTVPARECLREVCAPAVLKAGAIMATLRRLRQSGTGCLPPCRPKIWRSFSPSCTPFP